MFNKFEAFMNKWLMPIAQKVDKQRHLSAIKASMVAMTPFTILGSFFAIIPALPNMIGENNAFSQFILNNAELLDLPVTLSIGMMSVYVTMCIAYNLGNHYKLYIPGCITLSTFAFLFVAAENVEGGISITNFGAKGLFCAMLVGMAATELYRFCKEKNLTVRMPEGVPDFVSKSFELIPTTIIVAGTFIAVRFFSGWFHGQPVGSLVPALHDLSDFLLRYPFICFRTDYTSDHGYLHCGKHHRKTGRRTSATLLYGRYLQCVLWIHRCRYHHRMRCGMHAVQIQALS